MFRPLPVGRVLDAGRAALVDQPRDMSSKRAAFKRSLAFEPERLTGVHNEHTAQSASGVQVPRHCGIKTPAQPTRRRAPTTAAQ